MRVLSVDIGWRHLAYIHMIVTLENIEIETWEIVDIIADESINVNESTTDVLITKSAALLGSVVKKWSDWKPDIAYLENQPLGQMARNVKTKTLSHVMQALLIANGIPVQFVSPKKKLAGMEAVSSYYDNKKFAVLATTNVLENCGLTKWLEWFQTLTGKRDDLADALLQGYHAGKAALVARLPKTRKPRTKRKRDSHAEAQAAVILEVDGVLEH